MFSRFFGMISCQGGILETVEFISEDLENFDHLYLSDICSYTINNKTYSCDNRMSQSYVFAPVNPDPNTAKGYEDSLFFANTLAKFNKDSIMLG